MSIYSVKHLTVHNIYFLFTLTMASWNQNIDVSR